MQSRALAWERSLESMQVGIALYDRDDRLINCNASVSRTCIRRLRTCSCQERELDDLVTAYYKVAPAEVIDGRTLDGVPGGSASSPGRIRSH